MAIRRDLVKNARRGAEGSAEGVGEIGLVAEAAGGGDFLEGEIFVAEQHLRLDQAASEGFLAAATPEFCFE